MKKIVPKGKPKAGTSEELAALFELPKEIKVRVAETRGTGKTRKFIYRDELVVVSALPLEQLAGVIDILAPLVANESKGVGIWDLATEHREVVYRAFAHATGWDRDEIPQIHPGDFVKATQAIVEANADFFVRLLGPLAFGFPGIPSDSRRANGDGATRSPTSNGGDAGTPSASPISSSTPQ